MDIIAAICFLNLKKTFLANMHYILHDNKWLFLGKTHKITNFEKKVIDFY